MQELVLVHRFHLLRMILSILQFLTPVFSAFTLFVMIALTGKDGKEKITVFNIYAGYALLNITRLPLALMPMAYTAVLEAASACNVLLSLLSEEMDQNYLLTDSVESESNRLCHLWE